MQLHSSSRLRYIHAKWDLEEGRWAYNSGNGTKAWTLWKRAIDAVVVEPPPDSEEYANGERKSSPPLSEYKETEEEVFSLEEYYFPSEGSVSGTSPERDKDGYLVR